MRKNTRISGQKKLADVVPGGQVKEFSNILCPAFRMDLGSGCGDRIVFDIEDVSNFVTAHPFQHIMEDLKLPGGQHGKGVVCDPVIRFLRQRTLIG